MAHSSDVVILADDRTGALETAGRIAQRTGDPVEVRVIANDVSLRRVVGSPLIPICVIDTATRHDRHQADRRMLRLADVICEHSRVLHKIDSLLRGHWDIELMAIAAYMQRPAVMIPALPEANRVCVGGTVKADGIAVDQLSDARAAASTSRPGSKMEADNLTYVGLLDWVEDPDWIVVCDASTDADLDRIAELMDDNEDLVVSGTAEVVANAVAGPPVDAADPPKLHGPTVVIVGSVHPIAIAQADAVADRDGIVVVRSDLATSTDPDEVVAELAARAEPLLANAGTIVIVGGDTAAAVLGPDPMQVHGMVGPGMPWLTSARFPRATVITKPGSHGQPSTLVDVLDARLQP